MRGPARVADSGGGSRAVQARSRPSAGRGSRRRGRSRAPRPRAGDARPSHTRGTRGARAREGEGGAPPRAHVSDDPAHLETPFFERSIRPPPAFRRRSALSVPEKPPENENARLQPSSRETRVAILPQRLSAASSVSASTRTRTTGSVPDGRTTTRPPQLARLADLVLEGRRNLLEPHRDVGLRLRQLPHLRRRGREACARSRGAPGRGGGRRPGRPRS